MNREKNIKQNGIIKSKQLDFGTVALTADNILMFEPKNGVTTVNLNELKLMLKELTELCNNEPKPFFSNNRNVKSLGSEEREFIGSNIHHFATKSAIIENSAIVRFITHMIIHLNKPQIPMKMFKNEEDAIEWLKQTN